MHRSKREQRVFQVVPGQDRKGTLRAEATIEQGPAEGAHQGEGLSVGERAPYSYRIALGQERLSGGFARPVQQALVELGRIGAERMRRTDQDRAVAPAIEDRIRRTQGDLADRDVLRRHCQAGAVPDRVSRSHMPNLPPGLTSCFRPVADGFSGEFRTLNRSQPATWTAPDSCRSSVAKNLSAPAADFRRWAGAGAMPCARRFRAGDNSRLSSPFPRSPGSDRSAVLRRCPRAIPV